MSNNLTEIKKKVESIKATNNKCQETIDKLNKSIANKKNEVLK